MLVIPFRTIAIKLFKSPFWVLPGWILLAIYCTAKCFAGNNFNNYLIFKYSFFNALHAKNLYIPYPELYIDTNHYGPLFSLLMAPFSIMPDEWGMYVWQLANVILLYYAIQQLPLERLKKNLICLICTQELIISLREFQTNGAVAALIILAWIFVEKEKDFWAALFIAVGLFIKVYGIIGVAFFFISKQKMKFILFFLFWAFVLFFLPMFFFSPHFIFTSYTDWFQSILEKNAANISINTQYQDVSVMGMIKRIAGRQVWLFPFLSAGMFLFILSCYKVSQVKNSSSHILLLCSSLLFIVLFSTSSELVTYIIAFAGIGIWIVSRPPPLKKSHIAIFIFAVYFGSLFATDLFPHYIKIHLIKPFALKVFPCLIVWLVIIADMLKQKSGRDLKEKIDFNIQLFQKQY